MDIISGGQHAENIVSNFNDVLLECNLLDTSRLFHPESKEYTWSKTNLSVARRLDYILTSSDIFDKTGESSVFSVSMSDHRGCSGKGYWKLNNSLLQDSIFVHKMNKLIGAFLVDTDTGKNGIDSNDHQTKREMLKLETSEFSIGYYKQKSIEIKKKPIHLYN